MLGILVAISLPALVGYIGKAQDKQYSMGARGAAQAVRSVLDEAYAKGELSTDSIISDYIQDGAIGWETKVFSVFELSFRATYNDYTYCCAASALMGKTYPTTYSDPGYWYYYLVGSNTSATTAINADGFYYCFYPNGDNIGDDPTIVVTYRMQRIESATQSNDIIRAMRTSPLYNANADYEIYHFLS
jgi:type II secretory pathway pseudopilin PulG